MKIPAMVGVLLLSLVLSTSAFAKPDHGRGGDDRGPRKEQGRGHEKEHGRGSRDQQARGDRDNRPQSRHEERRDDRQAYRRGPEREHMREAKFHERDEHGRRDIWETNRSHDWKREHHNWRERGGYRGYRIPDERFHAYFGRGHWFRVHSVPVIVVDRRPRFQYAGMWFTMVEPWPEYWAPTWYQDDDVYVDYVNDGYYLCNRRHPGVSVAVNVSF
jgi:hypothetical protein